MYPNPVRNSINLTNPDQVDLEGYQIFDMKGRMIVSGRLSFGQNQIDLDNGFQEGVYLLKLYNQNESTRIKIVKSGI